LKTKLLAVAAILALILLAVYGFVSRSAPPQVPFATVARATLVDNLVTNGKAEPVEWIEVHAERGGPVLRVPVQKGQQIGKGAVLAELDATATRAEQSSAETRIEQARAELAVLDTGGRAAELADIDGSIRKARLELEAAQRDIPSLERLVEKKAATTVELNAARDRVAQLKAQIAALEDKRGALVVKSDRTLAQARLRDAEVAAEAAGQRAAQSVIRSPMAGTVYNLDVRQGAYLNPGDPVAIVGRLDRMRVVIYVDEPELGRVRAGMPVAVTWDARPGREWKGVVDKVPTEISSQGTRQVGQVICYVKNPGNELLPGTNVNASVRSQVVENALTVPKEALRRETGQSGVLLLLGNLVEWRPVKIGASSITRTQIVDGLKEGDRVALPSEKPVKSGDKVSPVGE
jgi:HlyD family secretion protein